MNADRTRIISISLPESLLKKADKKRGDVKRSTFFSRILEDALS